MGNRGEFHLVIALLVTVIVVSGSATGGFADDASVTAVGDLGIDLDVPTAPTAGEETSIGASISIPELVGTYESDLTVTLAVDGTEVDSETVTVEDGETASVSFSHEFDAVGSTTVEVGASITIGGLTFEESVSTTVDVAEPPIDGNIEVALDTPDAVDVGEETTIGASVSLPELYGEYEDELTVTLYADGTKVASEQLHVGDGETVDVSFVHEFDDEGTVTIEVEGEITLAGRSLSQRVSRELTIEPTELDEEVSIDGQLGIDVQTPADPVVGEEMTITPTIDVPDVVGDVIDGELTVNMYVDGAQVDSTTITVTDGDSLDVELTHVFDDPGTSTVEVEGEVTLIGETVSESVSIQLDITEALEEVPDPDDDSVPGIGDLAPDDFVGELTADVSIPDEPTVGGDTSIGSDVTVPELVADFDEDLDVTGNLEITLVIDGEDVAAKTFDVEDGQTLTVAFEHAFDQEGEVEVELQVDVTFGEGTLATVVGRTIEIIDVPGPEPTAVDGVAFSIPESVETDVDRYLGERIDDPGLNAFVTATRDDLYVVFTDQDPQEGAVSVNGFTHNESIELDGMTFGVIVASNVSFDRVGTPTTVQAVADTPAAYELEVVRIEADHRSIAVRTDPSVVGLSYATTTGILVEDPRSPTEMLGAVGEHARDIVVDPESETIQNAVDDPDRPFLFTGSFETSFWVDATTTVDGIVLTPGSAARTFVEEFDHGELQHEDADRPVVYLLGEKYDAREVDEVSGITRNAAGLDGEVVRVEARLAQQTLSVKHTLEQVTGCGDSMVQVREACLVLAHDVLLHGGVAWNTVPNDVDDVLLIMGASSWKQDVPLETRTGKYQITGEVVSTSRVDSSLPDGSILLIYDLDRVGTIDYEAVDDEARAIIEGLSGNLEDHLSSQLLGTSEDIVDADDTAAITADDAADSTETATEGTETHTETAEASTDDAETTTETVEPPVEETETPPEDEETSTENELDQASAAQPGFTLLGSVTGLVGLVLFRTFIGTRRQ